METSEVIRNLQLKYRLISITCENHQISQHTLYIIYTYVIHLSFLPLKIWLNIISKFNINEPRREKTGLRGFQPGLTQTDMYSPRSSIEARNFGFNKKRKCTIRVAKTKALISFAVTAKLICAFVFA